MPCVAIGLSSVAVAGLIVLLTWLRAHSGCPPAPWVRVLALAAAAAAFAATVVFLSRLTPESAGPLLMACGLGLGSGLGHASRIDRWTDRQAYARSALWLLGWCFFYTIAWVIGSRGPSFRASVSLLAAMLSIGRSLGIGLGVLSRLCRRRPTPRAG